MTVGKKAGVRVVDKREGRVKRRNGFIAAIIEGEKGGK